MKSKLITCLILFCSIYLNAQKQEGISAGEAKIAPIQAEYHGFAIPKSDDLELLPSLLNIASKNESENENELAELKAEKMKLKKAFLANYTEGNIGDLDRKYRGLNPQLDTSFNGVSNSSYPSDNSCAVNKSNILIAMVNSNMRTYNTTNGSTLTLTVDIDNFFSSIQGASNTCDPKVIFDAHSDRFIVFAQTCDPPSTPSKLLMAFSKTSDPMAGWYFYSFTGNPSSISQDVWFDYPKIGVSNHDVFVCGNFFSESGNLPYVESGIYQIDKTKCYAGQTLASGDAVVWTGINGNPFTLVPMSNGQNGGYGNNMYLVGTKNYFNGSFLLVYEINNAVQSNPQLSLSSIQVDPISSPADAIQKGTVGVQLETGDSRGQDGFYLSGSIHFVFHADVGSGYAGIRYYRLKKAGSSWVSDKNGMVSAPSKDFAFPAIASFGFGPNDQGALITFDYASQSEYPGIKSVYFDHYFTKSALVEVKTGLKEVTGGSSGGVTRWGDYSCVSRVQNAGKPTAWGFGMYGNNSNNWSNLLFKMSTTDFPVSTESVSEKTTEVKVYPNPVKEDFCKLALTLPENGPLEIYLNDMMGKRIRTIYYGFATKGEKLFTFNTMPVANGNYIVQFVLNNIRLQHEKISVAH